MSGAFGSYEFAVMTYPMYVRLRGYRSRLANPKRHAWPAGLELIHPRYRGEDRFTFKQEREQGIGARGFDVALRRPEAVCAECGEEFAARHAHLPEANCMYPQLHHRFQPKGVRR